MNDKMIRFLNSINLENIDRFDMDFDLVVRNQYNRAQVDMLIVKETPWKYELLEDSNEASISESRLDMIVEIMEVTMYVLFG